MSNEVRIRVTAEDKASPVFTALQSKTKGLTSAIGTGLKVGAAIGVTALLALGASSVRAASNFDESLNKVRVVFRESSGEIEAFAKNARTNLGLSRTAALDAAGTFGNLFTSMKIGRPAATEMSKGVLQLAADLASFNNIRPEEALDKLRAGLVGEVEPLRTLGVNLSAAAVASRAMAMGLADSEKELTPAAKAQAAYSLILEQTKNAQGDFARTSDGLANKGRILRATFEDLQVTIGQKLAPTYQRVMAFVVNTLNDPSFQNGVEKWSKAVGRFVEDFGRGFQKVVIPTFQWIINNQGALIAAIVAIGVAFAWVNPLGAALAGIAATLAFIGKQSKPNLTAQRAAVLGQLNTLGANPTVPGGYTGLPPVRPQPGSEADQERQQRIADLQSQLAGLDEQIAALDQTAEDTAQTTFPELSSSFDDLAAGAGQSLTTLSEAISDGVITMAEAAELKLTPAAAGAAEAQALLATEAEKAQERTFNLQKAIAGVSEAARRGEESFARFVRRMAEGALELQRQASGAIFGKPTQQEAQAQLRVAQLDKQIADIEARGGEVPEGLEKARDAAAKQLAAMEAENRVQQLRLEVADQSLLTEQEQNRMTEELIKNIQTMSEKVRMASDIIGEGPAGLVPAFAAARDAARDFATALQEVGLPMGRQHGGPATGWTLLGERGPEVARLPGGSHVYSNEDSMRMLSGGGAAAAQPVIVNIYGDIYDDQRRWRDLREGIEQGRLNDVLRRAVGTA